MVIGSKIKYILFFSILFCIQTFAQSVAINEVMSSNDTTISDEDGEFEDWIEIYNYGNTAVNLSGYGLSDDTNDAFKWTFPAVTIQPNSYLLVWASGKERNTVGQELHTNFKIKAGGEAISLTNASGSEINNVPAVAIATDSSYGRKPDGNGAFVFFDAPTPNASNSGAANADTEKIAINEVMTSNDSVLADEDGDFEDWIEIYNYGSTSVNLSGFGLSDDRALPFKWTFPSITLAPNQYILVWASDKNRVTSAQNLHANFKLQAGGETVLLTNPSGALVSGSPSVGLDPDISYGRQPDGTGSWFYFDNPTPRVSNTGTGSSQLLEAPDFSHDSGLYTSPINLTLSTKNQGATIVYTTDGSEPELNNTSGTTFQYKNEYPYDEGSPVVLGPMLSETFISNIYSTPITVSDITNNPEKAADKNSTPEEFYEIEDRIRKATIVKARTFLDGKGSKTVSRTFFVWNDGNHYKFPIVSLQTPLKGMFDYDDGIYNAGVTFDNWRKENPDDKNAWKSENNNYARSGREWEVPTSVEVFKPNTLESVLNINAGLRVHGNNSRGDIIKNLRLYARGDYDEKDVFEHNLFQQKIPDAVENNKYKRILLRGNGSGGKIFYDVVFNRLMQPMFNGIMRIEPAIHFINGEYWGITALRDRVDQYHFGYNFNLDKDNIVIVDCKVGKCEIDEGTDEDFSDYNDFIDFVIEKDMSDNNNYRKLKDELDVDSYINHAALEIFSENDSYELKFWKVRTPENNKEGDGRWRVTIQDFEASINDRKNWLEEYTDSTPDDFKGLLGNLLANEDFKYKFINRLADLLNTAYNKDRFSEIVNQTFDEVEPYLEEDENRAERSRFYKESDKNDFFTHVDNKGDTRIGFIDERPGVLTNQMLQKFGLPGTLDITLNISDRRAGYVKLNSIDIKDGAVGVKNNPYPWVGTYFENVPVTLEAVAFPGYVFTGWSGDDDSSDEIIEIEPSSNIQLTANYSPITNYKQLAHFWLMDNNLPNDTPLESMRSTYSRNNNNATLKFTSSLEGYPFDNNNDNWRKGSLERINAPTALNYREIANNNISYSDGIVRGLQIRQPFKSGSRENIVELNMSTLNYKNVKLSFVMKSDGAAQFLSVEYWDGSNWSNTNVSPQLLNITSDYQVKEVDFTNVAVVNNNENVKIRFRFNGTVNMFEDAGKKVFLNSIAVEGEDTATLSNEDIVDNEIKSLKVYPNPVNNQLKVIAGQTINKVRVYNIFGQTVYSKSINSENLSIDMSRFSSGMYLLQLHSGSTISTKKIIKK